MTNNKIYCLLYVNHRDEVRSNLRKKVKNPIDVYILNAATCAKSLRFWNEDLIVLTNDVELIDARKTVLGIEHLSVQQHPFSLSVPKGIPFYSAHFKIDVLKSFASGLLGDKVALVDLDMVFLNRFVMPDHGLGVYDITESHFEEFGADVVREELNFITASQTERPRWYGGEFISGTPALFRDLMAYFPQCWERYVPRLPHYHHVGEETVMSGVISLANYNGVPMIPVSKSLVQRWWSARTGFRQERFGEAEKTVALHLPSDKEFLASQAFKEFSPDIFVQRYRRHLRAKLGVRKIANALPFGRRRGLFAGSL